MMIRLATATWFIIFMACQFACAETTTNTCDAPSTRSFTVPSAEERAYLQKAQAGVSTSIPILADGRVIELTDAIAEPILSKLEAVVAFYTPCT